MLIDSHAHLDFYTERLTDRDEVLRRAWDADVKTILAIGIGEGPATMHQALDLARSLAQSNTNLPRIFATAGIHPQEASQATEDALKKVAALAGDPLCVAIGEIGLDYYHAENPDIPTQQLAFTAQIYIAAAARKPIIIHCRTSELATPQAKEKFGAADAWADTL